jgi:hypothetical protein
MNYAIPASLKGGHTAIFSLQLAGQHLRVGVEVLFPSGLGGCSLGMHLAVSRPGPVGLR